MVARYGCIARHQRRARERRDAQRLPVRDFGEARFAVMTSREPLTIPALLRAARGAYARAVVARLSEAGFDDIPRNASYVLGGMAHRGASVADLIRELDVSKQAASQLIDTLVVRGYLVREISSTDRRRLTIGLTDRGIAAAAAVRAGVADVDGQLAEMCGPRQLAGLRTCLEALREIREREAG
jgi:DNA-binding MarR family transcriptional regulator